MNLNPKPALAFGNFNGAWFSGLSVRGDSYGWLSKLESLFMVTLNNRCRIIIGTQNGTLILTTTHMGRASGDICRMRGSLIRRNLIKKPWAFMRVPYMNPTILGLYAQGFLIRFLH